MVSRNESMIVKSGVGIHHLEQAAPLHEVRGILWKKLPPGPQDDNSQIDGLLHCRKNTLPYLRVEALSLKDITINEKADYAMRFTEHLSTEDLLCSVED
jgi:hypothetical protein